MSNEDVVAELTKITGIGQWTAEIYLMFSMGRADVFAPGDLALQESARVLFDLDARPKERELRQMAESWSPLAGGGGASAFCLLQGCKRTGRYQVDGSFERSAQGRFIRQNQ